MQSPARAGDARRAVKFTLIYKLDSGFLAVRDEVQLMPLCWSYVLSRIVTRMRLSLFYVQTL